MPVPYKTYGSTAQPRSGLHSSWAGGNGHGKECWGGGGGGVDPHRPPAGFYLHPPSLTTAPALPLLLLLPLSKVRGLDIHNHCTPIPPIYGLFCAIPSHATFSLHPPLPFIFLAPPPRSLFSSHSARFGPFAPLVRCGPEGGLPQKCGGRTR